MFPLRRLGTLSIVALAALGLFASPAASAAPSIHYGVVIARVAQSVPNADISGKPVAYHPNALTVPTSMSSVCDVASWSITNLEAKTKKVTQQPNGRVIASIPPGGMACFGVTAPPGTTLKFGIKGKPSILTITVG